MSKNTLTVASVNLICFRKQPSTCRAIQIFVNLANVYFHIYSKIGKLN